MEQTFHFSAIPASVAQLRAFPEAAVTSPFQTAALTALAEQGIQMIYDTVHQVLAQGNYVLAVSEGTFGGAPTSYYDLWRVENGKVAEHWDVMETIAAKETWQNQNGKF